MPDKKVFEVVHKNINKCEPRLEKYVTPSPRTSDHTKQLAKPESENEPEKIEKSSYSSKPKSSEEEQKLKETLAIKETLEKYASFSEQQRNEQPKLCLWTYMVQNEVEHLLTLTNKQAIRKMIDDKMKLDYPKGISRLLDTELMYSLVRFCQKSKFNVKQVGALLSIFYLTHQYFLSSYYRTATQTYKFFKEYMLLHCFNCPPDSIQLFNYCESKHVVLYFCTLYLRNLPLIRLLTLPNFGFYLNYEKPPETFIPKMAKGKKKGKEKGKKKGKKK